MAPKSTELHTNDAVRTLCYLIMNASDFTSDLAEVGKHVGVADKKNVPRKINSLVSPYGFEFKNGKMTLKPTDALNGDKAASIKATSINKNGATEVLDDNLTSKTPTPRKRRAPIPIQPKGIPASEAISVKKPKLESIVKNEHEVKDFDLHDYIEDNVYNQD